MPVPKRYFHVSQELNLDPEVWELTEQFGDRAIRTWLQLLAFLDRSENRWRMTGESLKNLSRIVRQQSSSISRQVLWMISSGWLTVLETSPDGSPAVLSAPNWLKYNRRQEHKGNSSVPGTGAQKERKEIPSVPTPTPFRSVPKEEEKSEDKIVSLTRPRPNRGSVIPEDFQFDARAELLAKSYGLNPHKEQAAFRDFHVAKGTIFKDWQAAYRTWLRNAVKFAQKGAS